MKSIPFALFLLVAGVLAIVLGAGNGWWLLQCFGVGELIIGWIWFAYGWAKLMKLLAPIELYDKRVRRLEREMAADRAERAALDSAFSRRLENINKRHSQNVNGFLERDGHVIEFSNGKVVQKEETA